MSEPLLSKPKKARKSRKGLSLRKINLDKVHVKLLNSLARDVDALLMESRQGKLTKDDAVSLINYLKLLKDLRKDDKEKDNDAAIEVE